MARKALLVLLTASCCSHLDAAWVGVDQSTVGNLQVFVA